MDIFIKVKSTTFSRDFGHDKTEFECTGRLEEKNGKHRCYECPCLCMDDDKRKKSYPCAMGGVSRTDSPCCEWFYKALEKGQINVR